MADLGIIESTTAGLIPRPGTGAIWRVVPTGIEEGTPEGAEAATPAAAGGNTVAVSLTEFAIEMPKSIPAGPTAFEVTNDGTVEHNFEVEGQGIEEAFDENLEPGKTRMMELDLEPGTYEVYCPVGDHEAEGMALELTVEE